MGKPGDTERRKARTLYDFETESRERGWGDPAFVYDVERDLCSTIRSVSETSRGVGSSPAISTLMTSSLA